jgi:hypothetical protein
MGIFAEHPKARSIRPLWRNAAFARRPALFRHTIPKPDPANPHAPRFTIHSLFLLRRTEGAGEKIAEGLPAVIGEEAGSGAGKRI